MIIIVQYAKIRREITKLFALNLKNNESNFTLDDYAFVAVEYFYYYYYYSYVRIIVNKLNNK